jgi:hypothetical protein
MKPDLRMMVAVGAFLLGWIGLTLAQRGLADQTPKPTPETIVIVLKDRHWVIEELNETVFRELSRSGAISLGTNLQVSVRIMPQDTNSMCQIVYSQGFDRPYWRVAVGYDGKVKSVTKSIRREGD